jgi:hypothetical protein
MVARKEKETMIPRGYVTIMLDKERHLKINLNTLMDVQRYLGAKNVATMFVGQEFDFEKIRQILYLFLKHEDAELTPETVGELFDLSVVDQFDAIIQSVVGEAFGPFERLADLLVQKLIVQLAKLSEAFGTGIPSTPLQ